MCLYKKVQYCFLILSFIFCALALTQKHAFAQEMTIEQAYDAIPHQRTVYDAKNAQMSPEEKKFLKAFFHLVDLAMVERVGMLLWLTTNGQQGRIAKNYDMILDQMESLKTPTSLGEMKKLVVQAIEEQRSLLEDWHNDQKLKHVLILNIWILILPAMATCRGLVLRISDLK